jgi:hypothetical protein
MQCDIPSNMATHLIIVLQTTAQEVKIQITCVFRECGVFWNKHQQVAKSLALLICQTILSLTSARCLGIICYFCISNGATLIQSKKLVRII